MISGAYLAHYLVGVVRLVQEPLGRLTMGRGTCEPKHRFYRRANNYLKPLMITVSTRYVALNGA
jgi:hypothetical protein